MSEAAPDPATIALVDLSSIAHPIWHMSGAQPDPDYCSQQIVARVRALTANHPRAAICCDKGRSFRHDLSESYKANRPEKVEALHHQIRLAREILEADGYPVWAVAGFEADDLIATAATALQAIDGTTVRVFSADKDLLALVNERVTVVSTGSGNAYDAAAVREKFGVRPDQIRDYLALVGDASDNVKGAVGIGKVKAAELLKAYGTLDEVYRMLDTHPVAFKPAIASSLQGFRERLEETRALVTLRTDVELPFAELDQERRAAPIEVEPMSSDDAEVEAFAAAMHKASAPVSDNGNTAHGPSVLEPVVEPEAVQGAPKFVAEGALVPASYERQLEPRSLDEAARLANYMHGARMFNGYGSPQAVLSTILAGRELGLQAVAALRAFHVIEGKHALAADAMRGLVLRAGVAKYFRCVERTAERATFETLRAGEPEPVRLSYTIAEGRAAFGFVEGMPDKARQELEGKWARSGWGKHTADMLAARASSKLARLVYSDILFGLYAPEELVG